MAEDTVCPVANCELPVDIVLKSSDGSLVGAHHGNLAHFSEAFPVPGSVKITDAPIDLPEDGETLRVLMQFMHHQRLPNLADHVPNLFKKPTKLLALAEAAEKYLVYSAMGMCNLRIASETRTFPIECLAYAIRFDYPEIGNEAAPHSLTKNLEEVIQHLGSSNSGAVLAWVRYREKYLAVADEAMKFPTKSRRWGSKHRCADPTGHWERFTKAVLADLPQSALELTSQFATVRVLGSFLHYVVGEHLHKLNGCPRGVCQDAAKAWVDLCEQEVARIGDFSDYLKDA